MQRISLTWVIETFRAIDDLEQVKSNTKLWDNLFRLYGASNQIDALFQQ